jgi:hypothetical protein
MTSGLQRIPKARWQAYFIYFAAGPPLVEAAPAQHPRIGYFNGVLSAKLAYMEKVRSQFLSLRQPSKCPARTPEAQLEIDIDFGSSLCWMSKNNWVSSAPENDWVRPPQVWMAPDLQQFFSRDEVWSLAVMCPAFQCGLT